MLENTLLVLGIETSCDETGVALVQASRGLLAQALHSQIEMHRAYGGVVPELASRDHVRRVIPLIDQVLAEASCRLPDIDAIAVTTGPGLGGALLVGASIAHSLGVALRRPVIDIHHLEGHLLSPMLGDPKPEFPFVALLVSGGHTQLMRVDAPGQYTLLGETLDDAAGEAFDKTAHLLGLSYPGGPAISALANQGRSDVFRFPRPLLASGDLNFSFSGLKTAVLTAVRARQSFDTSFRADVARGFVDAVVDVLAEKAVAALRLTAIRRLVVAGGVGANAQLRERLRIESAKHAFDVFFPLPALCTDNGAMIAFAGLAKLDRTSGTCDGRFLVRPRWSLDDA